MIVHGLFGSGENWQTIARRFESRYTVYRVDLRNHGRSGHDDLNGYDHMTEDLVEFIEAQRLSSIRLLGHSMGGKVAMHLATHFPEWVAALIVADMAPRAYPPENRLLIDALLSVDLTTFTSRREVSRGLADSIPDARVRAFLLKGLQVSQDGSLSWKLNLKALASYYEEIVEALSIETPYGGPTLFLRGSLSDYIRDEDMTSIRQVFPQALLETNPDAGHWLHADQPDAFASCVLEFLEVIDG